MNVPGKGIVFRLGKYLAQIVNRKQKSGQMKVNQPANTVKQSLVSEKNKTVETGVNIQRSVDMEYCSCPLPIKMERISGDRNWKCTWCKKSVDPKSKMIDKRIENIPLRVGLSSETLMLAYKINEIIDLLKSNGTSV